MGVIFTSSLGAQLPKVDAELPQLESDSQEYDADTNSMVAKGNAELSHGNIVLKSDEIIFLQDTSTLKANDNVQLTRGSFRILSDTAEYDYFHSSFAAGDFRMGRHPLFLQGGSISGNNEEIEVTDGTIYFQEPDAYALNIKAKRYLVKDNETLEVYDATFRLGSFPIFYMPYFEQNIEEDSPIDYRGDVGYQGNLGAYVQNQALVRVLPELKIGANIDGYSERGFLGGPVAKYNWQLGENGDNGYQSGYINTGFIYDLGDSSELGLDTLGNPIRRSRDFIEWRHLGEVGDNIDIASTLSWWSDSEVTRDFREELFYDNQIPDSWASANLRGDNFVFGAFMRYQPNDWELVAQRMPEISFNLLPSEIFETTVYHRASADFVSLSEKSPTGLFAETTSNRFNAYYGLNRPTKLNDWATVTPVAGAMLTNYWNTYNHNGAYTRVLGEVGMDFEALITGHWNVKDEFWGIDGLRHVMKPIVQYRYIPAADAGNTLIPKIDTSSPFDTYLDPLGLANKRNIDDLYAENTIRYGLENSLQTRAKGYGSYDMAEFNIYHEFRFDQRPTEVIINPPYRPFVRPGDRFASDIYTELTVRPAYWLSSSIFVRIDPNSPSVPQVSTRTTVVDGEEWQAYVGTNMVTDIPGSNINQFLIGGEYRVNERNALRAEWRIDAELSELVEQYYSWQTRFANSWDIEFVIGYLQGATREDGFQAKVRVRLLSF
ncbi:LPS-assembly protein LptD [Cerasicoccus fimbriatus]|uniref:LPS-assembly protein LptD n=1 Tax=Cerasicoccus fimbriatus TaxID=3014554 RepID=UPI0022B4C374|nr:LPS assembly protein LptD [Cerasicoccus sp. TK19100]